MRPNLRFGVKQHPVYVEGGADYQTDAAYRCIARQQDKEGLKYEIEHLVKKDSLLSRLLKEEECFLGVVVKQMGSIYSDTFNIPVENCIQNNNQAGTIGYRHLVELRDDKGSELKLIGHITTRKPCRVAQTSDLSPAWMDEKVKFPAFVWIATAICDSPPIVKGHIISLYVDDTMGQGEFTTAINMHEDGPGVISIAAEQSIYDELANFHPDANEPQRLKRSLFISCLANALRQLADLPGSEIQSNKTLSALLKHHIYPKLKKQQPSVSSLSDPEIDILRLASAIYPVILSGDSPEDD